MADFVAPTIDYRPVTSEFFTQWDAFGDQESHLIGVLQSVADEASRRGVSKRAIWRALDHACTRARDEFGQEANQPKAGR